MENDGAEVTHRNSCIGLKLDLLREKGRAHVQVQSPVQVQTMDLTPSRSNALAVANYFANNNNTQVYLPRLMSAINSIDIFYSVAYCGRFCCERFLREHHGFKNLTQLIHVCEQTVIPDYLNGDPVGADEILTGTGKSIDLTKWLQSHTQAHTRPPLDNVINELKEQGIRELGASGACFAGRYVFDLALENIIKVAAVSHPSLLKIPDDLEVGAHVSCLPIEGLTDIRYSQHAEIF